LAGDKAVSGIAGDGDALAGKCRRNDWCRESCEIDGFWQVDRSTCRQGIGQGIETRGKVGDFGRLKQTEVAFGQAAVALRQGAEPAHAGRQAIAQQLVPSLAERLASTPAKGSSGR
jgi:hypothetical protein